MYIIHEPDEISFDKVGIKGKIFPTDVFTKDLEFVRIDTETGHATKIIEHESTFCYYVLEGSGYFEIDGEKEECTKGDLIVIPPDHAFIYKGNLKLLLITTPPWREDQEETIE
jgi:mannose-6-phosphate isomerase-like protein (cupin superfamily)